MGAAAAKRERTCIGCGARLAKDGFARIVRTPEGGARYDATGREPGRGAYVCSPECLDAAIRGRKVQRALRVNVGQDDIERIAADVHAAMGAQSTC